VDERKTCIRHTQGPNAGAAWLSCAALTAVVGSAVTD
jgi:hypothetical protein